MAKPQNTPVTEFPITLGEFIGTVNGNHESTKAFAALMKSEGSTAHRLKSEWSKLFDLFLTKPTSIPWKEWADKKKGGK
jgi:hypothetical protein